jgi:hypothetical protein
MCGIVGIINGKKSRAVNGKVCSYLRDAIVANSLRGFDSTGIVQASKDRKVLVYTSKSAVNGTRFVHTQGHHQYIRDADDTAFTFVHNRAATRGEVKDENAHPFQHTDEDGRWLIGCHNGTLHGWNAKDYKVDSDWALSVIAQEGLDAFEKLDGAYAFVWYGDREGTNTLNIIRNKDRPMFAIYLKGQDRMLFGSEYMMMLWLAQRNGLEVEDVVVDLEPGFLYQFSLDNPREFKKTHAPSYKTRPKHELLFEELNRIFKKERKAQEQKKGTPKPEPKTVVDLKPTGRNRKGNYVSAEEARHAKALDVQSQMVEMYAYEHLSADNELWGVCQVGEDVFSCLIRNVDKATADVWQQATSLSAKVVGSYMKEHGGLKEPVLILSRNVTLDTEEADELSEAIGSSIKAFQQEQTNATGIFH